MAETVVLVFFRINPSTSPVMKTEHSASQWY